MTKTKTENKPWHESQLAGGAAAGVTSAVAYSALDQFSTGWWESLPDPVQGWTKLVVIALLWTLLLPALRRRTWGRLYGLQVSSPAARWTTLRKIAQRSLASLKRKEPRFVAEGVRQASDDVKKQRESFLKEGRRLAVLDVDALKAQLREEGRQEIRDEWTKAKKAALVPIWAARRTKVGYEDHDDYLVIYNQGVTGIASNVEVRSLDNDRLVVCDVHPYTSAENDLDPRREKIGRSVTVHWRPDGERFGARLDVSWDNGVGERKHQEVYVAAEHMQPSGE